MSALAALRCGAAALLDAQGEPALAAMVRAARVEIAGPGETWAMGTRSVTAQRIALVAGAETVVALARDPAKLAVVREAFTQTLRSPETELLDLHVELSLPGIEEAWGRVYRRAPARAFPAPAPAADAVREGAALLLAAAGRAAAAEMLGRAQIDAAIVEGTSLPIRRYVVRLATADRARTWSEPDLEDQIRRAVHDAASRAAEQVVVEVGALPAP